MSEKLLPAVSKQSLWLVPKQDLYDMAQMFVDAGMCEVSDKEASRGVDAKTKLAMAAVKIQAGGELGLKPYAAIKGIHLIKGKATPSYQVLAALIRKTPGYDYKVLEHSNDRAAIEFFKDGESLGVSEFTTQDMVQANLANDMWRKYKRRMLYARAMTEGVNVFCPEVTDGPAYAPEDFDVVVDADLSEVEEKPAPKQRGAKSAATGAKAQPAPANATANAASPANTGAQSAASTQPPAAAQTPAMTNAPSAAKTEQSTASVVTTSTEGPPDVLDVEEISQDAVDQANGQRPGEDHWNQVLAAGLDAGLTEDQIEDTVIGILQEEGISTESQETIMAEWTFEIVEELVNALIAAGEASTNG